MPRLFSASPSRNFCLLGQVAHSANGEMGCSTLLKAFTPRPIADLRRTDEAALLGVGPSSSARPYTAGIRPRLLSYLNPDLRHGTYNAMIRPMTACGESSGGVLPYSPVLSFRYSAARWPTASKRMYSRLPRPAQFSPPSSQQSSFAFPVRPALMGRVARCRRATDVFNVPSFLVRDGTDGARQI